MRTAISRAYSYVYHLALARAKANGFSAKSGEGTHAQLWRLFTTSPDPDCKKLGQITARLREKRNRADYEPYFVRIEEEIPELLKDARNFSAGIKILAPRFPNPASTRR